MTENDLVSYNGKVYRHEGTIYSQSGTKIQISPIDGGYCIVVDANLCAPALKVKRLSANAKLPTRAYEAAAGWDISCPANMSPIEVAAHEKVKIPVGFAVEIPQGLFGLMRPRSSAQKANLAIDGNIDSDYRGEVQVVIHNLNKYPVLIMPGEAYAQMILVDHHAKIQMAEVDELSPSQRGEGGFGSSGAPKTCKVQVMDPSDGAYQVDCGQLADDSGKCPTHRS